MRLTARLLTALAAAALVTGTGACSQQQAPAASTTPANSGRRR